MGEPFGMEDFVEDGGDVDEAEGENPFAFFGSRVRREVHDEEASLVAGVVFFDLLDLNIEFVGFLIVLFVILHFKLRKCNFE